MIRILLILRVCNQSGFAQSIVILIIRNIVSYAELLVVLILMSQVLYVFGTEKIMKVN